MCEQQPIKTGKSSVFNLSTNILAALIFIVPAIFAWIPIIGYFAWIIPMSIFMVEQNSNLVRFCASESFCIGIIRLVCDVVFDSIRNTALRTAAIYGQSPDYIQFWGNVQSPGHTALVIGNILGLIFCLVCIFCALMAYNKKPIHLPVLGDVADFMTRELKPKFKHSKYNA